jgi:hypothetical protein
MKKAVLISILLMTLSVNFYAQTKKVLFIGNSFISRYDLPNMVVSLAAAGGQTIIQESATQGSYYFLLHQKNPVTITRINDRKWDYLILQEAGDHSDGDTAFISSNVLPNAILLDSLIKLNNPCTTTLLMSTWGMRYGDPNTCSSEPWNCTYLGMQQRTIDVYNQLSNALSAPIAPVGSAWRNCYLADSTTVLWDPDNLHENIAGEYLAACVIYATIFQTSPIGNSYISFLSNTEATFLQTMASHTVLDSLTAWNIGAFTPHAAFIENINSHIVQYTNNSTNATSYLWNFGDGNTDTSKNPVHTYSFTGTYQVTLTVGNGCITNSTSISIQIN